MSTLAQHKYDEARARVFNAAKAAPLGWAGKIPAAAIAAYPDLAADPGSGDFARTVLAFQVAHGFPAHERDGKLGAGSWLALVKAYAPVPQEVPHVLWGGRRVPVVLPAGIRLLTWEAKDGLNLHTDGGWSKRKSSKPELVVWHWGGLDPEHCRRTLANANLSSHFGVGRGVVYQWLDLAHKAWHAGVVNDASIGIDLCEQPELKWAKYYTERGYDKVALANPTARGPRQILSLDSRTAMAGRALVAVLNQLGLPTARPLDHMPLPKPAAFRGHIGHHHVSSAKWDIACYWQDLFGEVA